MQAPRRICNRTVINVQKTLHETGRNQIFTQKQEQPGRAAPIAVQIASADGDQFILVAAEADLFAVLDEILPVRVVVRRVEAVAVMLVAEIGDGAAGHDGLAVHCVGAGQIDGDGVTRGKHADVRDDGNVVLRMAVAVGRDLTDCLLYTSDAADEL